MSFCNLLRSCLKDELCVGHWRMKRPSFWCALRLVIRYSRFFWRSSSAEGLQASCSACPLPYPHLRVWAVFFGQEYSSSVQTCSMWSRRKCLQLQQLRVLHAPPGEPLQDSDWLTGALVYEAQLDPLWMANWIPPPRKLEKYKALGSWCFLSMLFGPLVFQASVKNPSCNISEGSLCGNLNAGFLGCATDIVVPYYKRNFEDCGAFANLFDLHRRGRKFSQGIVLAPAAPSNSELLF